MKYFRYRVMVLSLVETNDERLDAQKTHEKGK
jgi:hypothetical protein